MIDAMYFDGSNGQTVQLNTDTYPLTMFDMTVETATDERNRPHSHGLYKTFTYMGKRIFHMEGNIFAADSADFNVKRSQLIGPFIPIPEYGFKASGTLRILFTGMTEYVTSECYLSGLPSAPMEALSPSRGTFVLSVQAFDPALYGITALQAKSGLPGGGGGFLFPMTLPFNFGTSSGGSGDVQVSNIGNAAAWPTVTIYGPCKNPSLTITSFGQTFTLAFDGIILNTAETISVDFKNRTVISNTLGSAYNTVVPGSTWWQIPPGVSTVSFKAYTASGAAHAEINYNNAYML